MNNIEIYEFPCDCCYKILKENLDEYVCSEDETFCSDCADFLEAEAHLKWKGEQDDE